MRDEFSLEVEARLKEAGFVHIIVEGVPMLIEDFIGTARWKIWIRELREKRVENEIRNS